MTMTATPTAAGLILALDLGKYKTVTCAYDGATTAAQFTTVRTGRDALDALVKRYRPAVVVIEACALAGWVADLCADIGVPCEVANTASEAWKFKHTKRKTDKDASWRGLPVLMTPNGGEAAATGRFSAGGRRMPGRTPCHVPCHQLPSGRRAPDPAPHAARSDTGDYRSLAGLARPSAPPPPPAPEAAAAGRPGRGWAPAGMRTPGVVRGRRGPPGPERSVEPGGRGRRGRGECPRDLSSPGRLRRGPSRRRGHAGARQGRLVSSPSPTTPAAQVAAELARRPEQLGADLVSFALFRAPISR
jgi:hypothetical protein